MGGLILSGLTAFPLLFEVRVLASIFDAPEGPMPMGSLTWWILRVREGLGVTYTQYPFIAYGTDWLAFGHLVIALFFIGPFIDPVQNVWVIRAGLIACVAVIPLALICGAIREIPFYWRLIDCSFGIFGFLPLWLALKSSAKLRE
jgi:hypothetical protein